MILKRLWNGYSDIWKIPVSVSFFFFFKKLAPHFCLTDADIDNPIQISSPSGATNNGAPEPNPELIAMLADMGFTNAQARKALRETVSEKYLFAFFLYLIMLR
jgi:UBA/TS-N domain